MKRADAPIYPTGHSQSGTGITLREHFAAMSLNGLLSGFYSNKDAYNSFGSVASQKGLSIPELAAKNALEMADALLTELEKK